MSPFRDPVTLTHPDLPGVEVVKDRSALPALNRAGWVEKSSVKRRTESPAANAGEPTPSREDTEPSKEES